MSVPAITLFESAGSITNALTGTCGNAFSPEPFAAVQFGVVRLVVFQTLMTPKADSVMYATFWLFGSIATRATKALGTTLFGSRLVIAGDPVVVPHRPPLRRPTTRTLSFAGEIPIALIGMPAGGVTALFSSSGA